MNERHPQVPLLGLLMMMHGGILSLLAAALVCSSPLQMMEGEELAVIVLGVSWGLVLAVVGPLTLIAGRMLRSYRGRWFAVVMATVQLVVSGCFCGGLSIVIWAYAVFLLVFNRQAVASFYAF